MKSPLLAVVICGLLLPRSLSAAGELDASRRHDRLVSQSAPPESSANPPASPLPPLSPEEQRRWLYEHVIASDTKGMALDPYSCLKGPPLPLQVNAEDACGQKLLKTLGMEHMLPPTPKVPRSFVFRDYVVRHMLEKAQESHKPIVIFAHGGLNFLTGAIKRAAIEGPVAEKDCYPIFICWDSSFSTSYWDHLTKIRNGVNLSGDHQAWAWATSPIYLATDLATSVVRAPRMLVDLSRSNLKGWSFPQVHNDRIFGDVQDAMVRYYALHTAGDAQLSDPERQEVQMLREKLGKLGLIDGRSIDECPHWEGDMAKVDRAMADLKKDWTVIRQQPRGDDQRGPFYRIPPSRWGPIQVSKGNYEPTLADSTARIVNGWLFAPPKLLVLSILGGAGGDMWDVMSRRTQDMYHYEPGFRPNWGSPSPHVSYRETNSDTWDSESTGIGCLAVFFRKLEEVQQKKHQCRDVTLVGHSMGAMVMNEALREFPSIHYQNIVYMAAACSIRDFNNTAVPYLEREGHQHTQFYSICLHPRAEDRDVSFWELVPRGSLLVWIDEFLGHPESFTDRRLGHFENALLASRLFPPRIQNRIHLTALATGPAAHEFDEHGDFSSAMFWHLGFYTEPANVVRKTSAEFNFAHPAHAAEAADNARRYLP